MHLPHLCCLAHPVGLGAVMALTSVGLRHLALRVGEVAYTLDRRHGLRDGTRRLFLILRCHFGVAFHCVFQSRQEPVDNAMQPLQPLLMRLRRRLHNWRGRLRLCCTCLIRFT
jgi:hypothetical protein